MFMGEYHHIGNQNRRTFLKKFNEIKTLNNLYLYAKEQWQEAQTFIRTFLASVFVFKFDKGSRSNITSPLVKYASLEKIGIGVNDRYQLKNVNNSFSPENISKLAINKGLFEVSYETL